MSVTQVYNLKSNKIMPFQKNGMMIWGVTMKLILLKENYVIVKLKPNQGIPQWAYEYDGGLLSITYTAEELSIVCKEEKVPEESIEHIEKTWKCLKVEGPLDFSLTGILYKLAKPLAEQKISIFAISTYETDYLLVKSENIDKAIQILGSEGHFIT
jgi:hypothetical protein